MVLVLAALACAACDSAPAVEPAECRSTDDCGENERCVSRKCVSNGVRLDAGVLDASDAGAPDARSAAGFVDAGFVDAGFVDAGFVDAGFVDAGFVDAGFVDAGFVDAGFVDAGFVDAGFADAGFVDAGFVDAGFLDAGVPDAGGPVARGIYDYRRVIAPNIPSNRLLTRLAISPDDQRLVVSERYDVLHLFDVATETTTVSVTLPKDSNERIRIDAISYAPAGDFVLVWATALVGASNTPEARLFRAGPSLGGLVRVGTRTGGRNAQAIAIDATTGEIFLFGYSEIPNAYLAAIQRYDDATRTIAIVDQTITSAGCQDLDLVRDDGLGGRGLVFACGINGAQTGVRDSTGAFSFGGNVGNTAHVASRPQGDYALFVSWSGGTLGRFAAGSWTLGSSAPSLSTSSAWNVAFSSDGARALITGQYVNAVAVLREFRHGAYNTNELTDVSILGFDIAPWLGGSGVLLEEAAWRAGGDCGYVVGGCSTVSCARGYLVAFSVVNGRPCP
ncbi:hypothetical protein L6R52_20930 [Myxococcota bacterium]|nr:hypothetical protein [Myxococcota bacterium]